MPNSIISEVKFLNEVSLSDWLKELDKFFMCFFGVKHSDFEDYNWDDEYDSEVSPQDAFEEWKSHTENGTRSVGSL